MGPNVASLLVRFALIFSALGCEYLKDKPPTAPATVVRCEQIAPTAAQIPEERKKRLDEIADLNSFIDLAIARRDKELIDTMSGMCDGARTAYREARDKGLSSSEQGKRLKWSLDCSNDLDKTLETAAKHRYR